MIKLSFLILTHNRPELFKRCLLSILQFDYPFEIEILVNNDSQDITEIYSEKHNIKYSYIRSNTLSHLYKYLFETSRGEYIYYLEDDDYLSKNFLKHLNLKCDVLYMNYKKVDTFLNFSKFKIEEINENFQLSQIIFRRILINEKSFPNNNDLDNDWKLFQSLKNNTTDMLLIPNIMFIQTCDGKDNISFPEYNKDVRWSHSF